MQLQQHEHEIAARQLAVLVVTFESRERAQRYAAEMKLPWPLLVDESRRLAWGYGMDRGRRWDLYGPAAIWTYLKLLARGRRLERPTDDVTQLGGDILVGADARVLLHHVGSGPADRPAVSEILERLPVVATD